MRNPSGRGSKAWFWSGVILLSISLVFWLLLMLGASGDPELDLGALILGGVIITLIPTGLGLFCLNRGRKSRQTSEPKLIREVDGVTPKEAPSVVPKEISSVKAETKTLSRRQRGSAELVGGALVVIGIWVAIISLPAISNSVLFFLLIGGPGVIIGYNLKSLRLILSIGFGVAAWGYAFAASGFYATFNFALLIDSFRTVVPIAVFATWAFAWLGRKKLRRPEWLYSTNPEIVTAFKKLAPLTLLILAPFIVGGLHDYNARGDTSPAQVITLRVVDRWIVYTDDNDESYRLKGEALDGSGWFTFGVSESFYKEHDIDSLCWIKIRSGALGYEWKESYGD